METNDTWKVGTKRQLRALFRCLNERVCKTIGNSKKIHVGKVFLRFGTEKVSSNHTLVTCILRQKSREE